MKLITSLLTAPVFEGDEERTQNARLLHVILWTFMISVTVYLAISILVLPENIVRWLLLIGIVDTICLISLGLNRRGYTSLASVALIVGLWAIVTASALTAGGIYAPAVTFYVIIVFIAGLLLGGRASVVIATVCFFTGFGMVYAEMAGSLPPNIVHHTPLSLWVANIFLLVIVIGLQYLATKSIKESLHQARRELKERQKAQQALSASEAQFRLLAENSSDIISGHDTNGTFLYVSPACQNILGYAPEELIGQSFLSYIHPDDAVYLQGLLSSSSWDDPTAAVPYRARRKNNEYIWLETTAKVIYGQDNRIIEIQASSRDITERKQTEEALRESGERLQLFFDQSLAGFFFSMIDEPIEWNDSIDKEKALDYLFDHQRITEANDAMVEQYGATRAGFLGRTTRDFFAHNLVEARQFHKKLCDQGHLHISMDERKDDGTPIWTGGDYFCMYDKQGYITGVFGIQRDITERKRAEQEIRENEQRYRALFEQSNDAIFIMSLDRSVLAINQHAVKLFGYSEEETIGVDTLNALYMPPTEIDDARRKFEQIIAGEKLPIYERAFIRKDGSILMTEINLSLIHDMAGKPWLVQSIIRDISERKRAEEALRQNEHRLRMVLDNLGEGVAVQDSNWRYTYANPAAHAIVGWPSGTLVGATEDAILSPASQTLGKQHNTLRGKGEISSYETQLVRPNGEVRTVIATGVPRLDEQGRLLETFVAFTDITERKQAEEELQRARQRLVSAVEEERRRLRRDLHDGLGPNLASQGLKLAAVRQLLENDLASAAPLLDQVMAQNKSTVKEVRRLVYGLRPPALDELGLVAAIRDHIAGIDGNSILQINVTEPPQGLPPLSAAVEVAAYRIVLEALTNIMRHAQAKHCTIRFSLSQNGSNGNLQIEVVDNGIGLPHDLHAGVGLRSMRERAEELGGTFVIESDPGPGTRVRVRLPLVVV